MKKQVLIITALSMLILSGCELTIHETNEASSKIMTDSINVAASVPVDSTLAPAIKDTLK